MRAAWLIVLTIPLGCASSPYVWSGDPPGVLPLRPGELRVEHGRPQRFVDGLGHYVVSLPVKLLLLSWHVENHQVTPETEAALLAYLDGNGLCEVKVRINQYAPGGEWSRLFRNRDVNGFWRYTIGFVTVLFYAILPQRVFGGDNYNPYTNTISIYSDESAIALHEGGHAKDFAERPHKGLYGALRLIPLVPLYQEGVATGDAVSYLRGERETEREKRAYPLLWGAWGTYLGGEGARWFVEGWVLYLVQLPAAWGGRLVGWIHAKSVPDPAPDASVSPPASPPVSVSPPGEPPPGVSPPEPPPPGSAEPEVVEALEEPRCAPVGAPLEAPGEGGR